jgi:type IX secretion system PorP/SprF family membrane protein
MKKLVIVLICGLVFLAGKKADAQQINPNESQYFTNQYLANPAMIGLNSNTLLVNVAYRNQWSEIPGSPKSALFTGEYHGENNASFGLQMSNQSSGMLSQTRVLGTYSYRIRFAEKDHSLRLGISLGWTRDHLDYSKAIGNLSDAEIYSFNSQNSLWDADAGFAYQNQDFTVQGSLSNLRRTFSKEFSDVSDYQTYYFAANYKVQLTDDVTVNPKVAFRGIHNFDMIADIGAELVFKEPLQLMGMYHTNGSLSGGASYLYDKKMLIFGIYSSASDELRNYGGSTFEFGIGFTVPNKKKK